MKGANNTTWVICLMLLTTRACHGTLHALQDSQAIRPNLATGEQNQAPKRLAWWEGGPAFALASAGAVRINFRGIILYPSNARVRDFSSPGSSAWHSVVCNVSAQALCSSDIGLVFPSIPPRMPEKRAAVQVDGWADMTCSNSEGKVLTDKGVYDISACDIFDEGLDVLYSGSRIAHRHASTPLWQYWTMVILAIILVRNLSYNLQDLWDKSRTSTKEQWPALLSSLVLLVLVLIDGDSAFVTSGDQLFFWSTTGYVLIYLVVHVWNKWGPGSSIKQDDSEEEDEPQWLLPHDQPQPSYEDVETLQESKQDGSSKSYEKPVYNILVATLQLVAMHFYSSAQTPYNIILLGMLACRGW